MMFFRNKICDFIKDIPLFYTFFAILLKSIVFLGFIININHSGSDYFAAFSKVTPYLAYYCSFIGIFLSFAFLFKNRFRLWYLIFLNASVSVLLMIDLWYYRAFETMTSWHLLKQTANLNNLSASIFSMIHQDDLVFIFDILLLLALVIKNKKIYLIKDRQILLFALSFFISVAYISYIPVKVYLLGKSDPRQEVFKLYDPGITTSNLSPIGYHVLNTLSYWKDSQPLNLTQEEKDEINMWFTEKREIIPDNKYKSLLKGKNLILIQVESLENFVINQKISDQEITPTMNRLLKNSLYFPNIYEQVNEGTSSDADLIANTSVYPVRRGSTFFRYPYNTYNSLPKLLQKQGYATMAIHPDKGSFWNWMVALKSIGFEKCIDSSYFIHDEIIGLGLSDGSYLRQLEPIVTKQKQPFYIFLVTLTSHGPFNLPQEYRELILNDKLDQSYLGGYFQSVHYTDKQIGIFLTNLEKEGLLDNTVIVIYGDHGGVHKYYQSEIQKIQPYEDWWLEKDNKIPFIIYHNQLQGEKIQTTGGQIDMLPTISYLMGVEEKEYSHTAMGRNLLKTKKDFAVLANRKYIGGPANQQAKEHAMKGLDIADKIIRSNYFNTFN